MTVLTLTSLTQALIDSQDLLRSVRAKELDAAAPKISETIESNEFTIAEASSPFVALTIEKPRTGYLPVTSLNPDRASIVDAPRAVAFEIDQAFLDQLHELRSMCKILGVEEVQTVYYPSWGLDGDDELYRMEMERLCVGADFFQFQGTSNNCDERFESTLLGFDELAERLKCDPYEVISFCDHTSQSDAEDFVKSMQDLDRPAPC
ncbi:hypothetical protein [Xanthomonas arboricola]|uniref:Uncharacterized protein n=1 Tax=Xanthomonas arboricola TaxID=56448 RepID=A0AB73H4B4_9XANT|nr:hypothetical protein [Xanthomonas arboricola]MBB5672483.1 hypothetical protein [Xanthomonas arboricola]